MASASISTKYCGTTNRASTSVFAGRISPKSLAMHTRGGFPVRNVTHKHPCPHHITARPAQLHDSAFNFPQRIPAPAPPHHFRQRVSRSHPLPSCPKRESYPQPVPPRVTGKCLPCRPAAHTGSSFALVHRHAPSGFRQPRSLLSPVRKVYDKVARVQRPNPRLGKRRPKSFQHVV